MSNRLAEMRKARTTSASVFAQILQLNTKYSTPLFCCFEGEDFKYYGVRIDQAKQKEHEKLIPLKCGGKKEVIRLYELVNKETTLTERDFIYFVDLDFDSSINELKESIYETPYYSIENFYTTKCAFEKILSSELKINEGEALYEYCVQTFIERQTEFHQGVSYLNAWVYCQRMAEVQKLYLNEFKLNKLIDTFDIDKVSFKPYDKSDLVAQLPNAIDIEDAQITEAIGLLDVKPQEKYRGKFEIEFLYLFLVELISRINKKVTPFEKCKKVGLSISKANILSELSQYALTPGCLKEYIKKSA